MYAVRSIRKMDFLGFYGVLPKYINNGVAYYNRCNRLNNLLLRYEVIARE